MHSALRNATGDLHARIDARMAGGFGARADYARYLRGMHAFMRAAHAAQPAREDWRLLHADLAADLDVLGAPPLDLPVAPEATDEAARLGWDYVVGGAALGSRVLLRDARALGIGPGNGAAFLARHAASGGQWPALLARLAAHPGAVDAAFVARCCQAARDAFHHADTAMAAACENPT